MSSRLSIRLASTCTTAATSVQPTTAASRAMPYLELCKARLTSLVVASAGAGFLMASPAAVDWPLFGTAMAGTALAACSANSLNQIREVVQDGLMSRTRGRPLPSKRLTKDEAMRFAVATGALSVAVLTSGANALAATLAFSNILLYAGVYTPMKQTSELNTAVGAVVGAIPPLIGWAAASGSLAPGAWLLFATLFAWQMPHFLSLALVLAKDYTAGGYKMLSTRDPRLAAAISTAHSVALISIPLLAVHFRLASPMVLAPALLLNLFIIARSRNFHRNVDHASALSLFLSSLIYLPLLFLLLLLCRIPTDAPAHSGSDSVQKKGALSSPLVSALAKFSHALAYPTPFFLPPFCIVPFPAMYPVVDDDEDS